MNVYLSVHNNPINHVDPLGLWQWPWSEKASRRPAGTTAVINAASDGARYVRTESRGYGEAFKATVGQADPQVQATWDQGVWDRSNGTVDMLEDQVQARTGISVDSNGGTHTFDAENREAARETGHVIVASLEATHDIATFDFKGLANNVKKVSGGGDDAVAMASTGRRSASGAAEGTADATRATARVRPEGPGVYEFPDQANHSKPYVGSTADGRRRLSEHEAAGRYEPGTEAFESMPSSTQIEREVAEHRRIQQHTGGQPARRSDNVSNKKDPIGPARQHLLDGE